MDYDPATRLPSVERDIMGMVLWALLVTGLCLHASAAAPPPIHVAKAAPCAGGERARG